MNTNYPSECPVHPGTDHESYDNRTRFQKETAAMSCTPQRPTREQREEMRANGIICVLCLYLGLGHDGNHA